MGGVTANIQERKSFFLGDKTFSSPLHAPVRVFASAESLLFATAMGYCDA